MHAPRCTPHRPAVRRGPGRRVPRRRRCAPTVRAARTCCRRAPTPPRIPTACPPAAPGADVVAQIHLGRGEPEPAERDDVAHQSRLPRPGRPRVRGVRDHRDRSRPAHELDEPVHVGAERYDDRNRRTGQIVKARWSTIRRPTSVSPPSSNSGTCSAPVVRPGRQPREQARIHRDRRRPPARTAPAPPRRVRRPPRAACGPAVRTARTSPGRPPGRGPSLPTTKPSAPAISWNARLPREPPSSPAGPPSASRTSCS